MFDALGEISGWRLTHPLEVLAGQISPVEWTEGFVCNVARIPCESAVFGGQILKVLKSDELTLNKYKMFVLNIEALELTRGTNGSTPRLLKVGVHSSQPAIIEEFLPGVKDIGFDTFLQSLDAQKRSHFYRSLIELYTRLAVMGVIHADPQERNFAIGVESNAGLIDFGIVWINGSKHNIISSREEAELKAITGLMGFIQRMEKKSPDYMQGVHHLKRASVNMQTLYQFAEAAQMLRAD